MENQNLEKESKTKIQNFKLKFSLFNKPLKIQYIILILWLISLIFLVYYVTYSQFNLNLIQHGILPRNINNVMIIASALVVGGIGLLFFPNDPIVKEREDFVNSIHSILDACESLIGELKFNDANSKLEEIIEKLNFYHVDKFKKDALGCLQKNQINLHCETKIVKIKELLEKDELIQVQMAFQELNDFISTNFSLILDYIIKERDNLYEQINLKIKKF